MIKVRYEIEGYWSGYRAEQRRIVHRETTSNKHFIEWLKHTNKIYFTDGTSLDLKLRVLNKGERKKPDINGYTELISDCYFYDVNSVDDLIEIRKK